MRARAGHAIILRNSLVERGGDVKEPSGFELRWPCPFALADAAGEVGKVLEDSPRGLQGLEIVPRLVLKAFFKALRILFLVPLFEGLF